jgi:hypothetical protein
MATSSASWTPLTVFYYDDWLPNGSLQKRWIFFAAESAYR